ncbi:hypothetical protein [Lignipirellula cremea]|uniref:Zinc finger/thioredoxin putative domain-containing protein n=1 Tax=Lignipirellula cremea TaxID=2528010 RepID=A0A518DZG5_9BACT|nr:hypothetical protein [Lignipirellula cremea]QDU97236.1 hypothetical protein Pla8534_50810 [Lignipirellula cremea]
MPIAECPRCMQRFQAKEKLAGKKVKCPRCEAVILIPGFAVEPIVLTPIPCAPPPPPPPPPPTLPPIPYSSAVPTEDLSPDIGYFLHSELDSAWNDWMNQQQQQQSQQGSVAGAPSLSPQCVYCRSSVPRHVTTCPFCGKDDCFEFR